MVFHLKLLSTFFLIYENSIAMLKITSIDKNQCVYGQMHAAWVSQGPSVSTKKHEPDGLTMKNKETLTFCLIKKHFIVHLFVNYFCR